MLFEATFKALADPTRRRILELLRHGEMSAGELCARFDATGATISHHLSVLKAAGLGCCMANGTPDAKAAADRIIGDVREDGLADLIDELWFDGPRAEPSGRELGSPWDKIESAGGQ